MNTVEVIAMIDAISEGRPYLLKIEGDESKNESDFTADFFSDRVVLGVSEADGNGFIKDPRAARELAGALLAWAKRQELGENIDRRDVGEICVLTAGTSNVEFPSVNDWAEINSGRSTREEWYRRNVPRMTPETLKRNRDDLRTILSDTTNQAVSEDIVRAINVISDELYKRDQG